MELTPLQSQVYTTLDELGVEHTTLPHQIITTMEQGKEIMKQLKGTVPLNLLLKSDVGSYYLVIKSMNSPALQFKPLAKQLGVKSLNMVGRGLMPEILKVPPGCVTVFALSQFNNLTVLIDKTIDSTVPVNFHPMRNDATTTIPYEGMIKFIEHYGVKWSCF